MQLLKGVPASPGRARGRVVLYRAGSPPARTEARTGSGELLRPEHVAAEVERFRTALAAARAEIEALLPTVKPEQAAIFQVHRLMLDDPLLVEATEARIRARAERAEDAVSGVVEELVTSLRTLDDDYLRQRASDVEDVCRRLLRRLARGTDGAGNLVGRIVVALDLTPSDVLKCSRAKAAALATQEGAASSHAAILARSVGLPAVVGVAGLLAVAVADREMTVDGAAGEVVLFAEGEAGEPGVSAPPGTAPEAPIGAQVGTQVRDTVAKTSEGSNERSAAGESPPALPITTAHTGAESGTDLEYAPAPTLSPRPGEESPGHDVSIPPFPAREGG